MFLFLEIQAASVIIITFLVQVNETYSTGIDVLPEMITGFLIINLFMVGKKSNKIRGLEVKNLLKLM